MHKIDKILILVFVLILAGYSIHMNIKLNSTINQYESDSDEMAKKFEKLNETMIREREEIAVQKAAIEKAAIAAEEVKAESVKAVADVKQEAVQTIVRKEDAPVAITVEQAAKVKAEKAKAEVEAMLGQVNRAPQPWQERESHL